MKAMFVRFLQRMFEVAAARKLAEITRDVQRELLAAQYLQPYMPRYFPWTTGALRPSSLITIANEIIINQRQVVVECGSGASTMLIAQVLKEHGGHLYTIEEDTGWATFVENALQTEKLAECATVLNAPLAPCNKSLNGEPWYDTRRIESALGQIQVDLLVVDGPGVGLMRYPAAPYFKDRFASEYAVVLDDLPRGGKHFVGKWQELLNIPFRDLNDFAWGTTNPMFKLFLSP